MRRNLGLILASAAAFIAGGSAFAQVAGDECTNAITAVTGVPYNFNTTTMTASANPPADGPCPFLDWGASKDIWYKWIPTGSGLATISLCDSAYDTSLVVYSGACASLTRLACDDDTCSPSATYESIITNLGVTAGTTYYIRIGGWNAASGAGTMLLTVEDASAGCNGATGACNQPHGGVGCSDAACCTQVCTANPLCCDLGWDLDCVNSAVELCGVFYYNCVAGGPPNNCATNATLVTASGSYPFNSAGATVDGPNHPGGTCQSGNDFFYNDIWWKFVAQANGVCTVSTCGTVSYDNKLAVYAYDTGTTPDFGTLNTTLVACNDDGASGTCYLTDGTTPYASALSFNAFVGKTYWVRMGSYTSGQTGTGTINFTLPQPCQLPNPTGTENEVCGANGNGGCNDIAGGSPVQPISLGNRIGGTFWADGGNRDTDWYGLTISSDTQVTAQLSSDSFSTLLILGDSCTPVTTLATGSGSCPNVATACLRPGNYKIFVAAASFEGLPCGSGSINNYVLEVTGAPATCPVSSDTCDDPGPDTVTQSGDQTLTVGGVACGGATTAANSYARSFPGLSTGEIRCIEVGYSNSGAPVAASIILCRDTNGGAPESIGTDLVELARRDFVPLTGFGFVTAQFDEPVCIDGNTNPLVVVLDIAASTTGFVTYAGNELAATAPTYILSAPCGLTTFTDVASIGFGELQWVVGINGDFSGCGTGGIPGDLNGDGVVNAADLAILLGQWGGPGSADLNGDGTVSAADLAILLGAWG